MSARGRKITALIKKSAYLQNFKNTFNVLLGLPELPLWIRLEASAGLSRMGCGSTRCDNYLRQGYTSIAADVIRDVPILES